MSKKTSISVKSVTFFCTTCNNKYDLVSGHKEDVVNIDICSNCHPFYQGKQMSDLNLGPADKLRAKFEKGKAYINKGK